jgi:hypothetical protein
MSEPTYTSAELMAKVTAIIKAMQGSEGGAVNVSVCLDALAFVAAVLYDLDPTVKAPSQMRKAAELQGGAVLTYLKHLRRSYEASGVRFGEAIGGTVEIDPALLAEMTKGATKQ